MAEEFLITCNGKTVRARKIDLGPEHVRRRVRAPLDGKVVSFGGVRYTITEHNGLYDFVPCAADVLGLCPPRPIVIDIERDARKVLRGDG